MPKIAFPSGRIVFENRPYTKKFLESTLAELRSNSDFTGFLCLERGDDQDLLFFLKGRPYAAGRLEGKKPLSRDIKGFISDLPRSEKKMYLLSLHDTDPVILKSMLVFIQKEPDISSSVKRLDFNRIMRDLNEKASDALIIIIKESVMNFFFFLKGRPVMSRYVKQTDSDDKRPVAEQLRSLVSFVDPTPSEALIYSDISTSEAPDAEDISEAHLFELLYGSEADQAQTIPSQIVLDIIEGPDIDKRFAVALPCSIGRKEGVVILHDKMVSGRHAVIHESGGALFIEDLNSTNGTFVNGEEIKKKELFRGEIISMGKTRLKVSDITLSES